ncbi:MAG TPA: DUF3012 domain-containing protein [Marinagarivorans sp.]
MSPIQFTKIALLSFLLVALAGCAKVGSERWCERLAEKPKTDWTVNEASGYAKHCIFKSR